MLQCRLCLLSILFISRVLWSQPPILLSGCFVDLHPVPYRIGMHLSDVALNCLPTSEAFSLGFQLRRQDEIDKQKQLKQQLLLVLAKLAGKSQTSKSLMTWLLQQPVTGRLKLRTELLNTVVMPQSDPLLIAGDQLWMPSQPQTVHVLGWVKAQHLTFRAGWSVVDYLRNTPLDKVANRNHVWLIQPDGQINQVPTAYWNRGQTHINVAPGAWIYVPIRDGYLSHQDKFFNRSMANYLATLPIDLSA